MNLETNDRLETGRCVFLVHSGQERGFFEKRCKKSGFENLRKDAREQGRVDESSEKRKESNQDISH